MNTITGQYVLTGNPCMSIPCLPGMVYAVLANNTVYILTVRGAWLWAHDNHHTWNGYAPTRGDHVKVRGHIDQKRDVKGDIFYEIEVMSVKQEI